MISDLENFKDPQESSSLGEEDLRPLQDKYKIPAGVSNPTAYWEYIKMSAELEKTKNRYKQTSDPRLRIDLCTSPSILKKMMKHLPQEEQDNFMRQCLPFRQHLQKLGVKKREAFGQLKEIKSSSEFSPLTVKQSELIEYFGKHYTVKEVHKIVIRDWGYDVSQGDIREFYKNNIDKIVELQKDFESNHDNVRLGKRRSRLEELSWIYARLKDKFVKSEDSVTLANTLKGLLESIKKEVDGDLVINGKMKLEVEMSINKQIYADIMKDFNLTQLIISRVAGRLNINPLYILSRLANSHYAKFTGFAKPDVSREIDEIYYPSQVVYDFDRIQQLYQTTKDQDSQEQLLPEVILPLESLSLKEKLQNKLQNKIDVLKSSEDEVDLNIKAKYQE